MRTPLIGVVILVLALPLARASADELDVADEPLELTQGPETGCIEALDARAPAEATVPVPEGRAIGQLGAQTCHRLLREAEIEFEEVDSDETRGVGIPIRLRGPLGGLTVDGRGHSEINEVLDCRLAVALLAWAPTLREEGVTGLRHFSMYRPNARIARSGRVSGHAHGLAIDLGVIERGEERLDVLEAWESRERGESPCEGTHEESDGSAALRRVVCSAVAQELFQVVLTPHHDRAHANHIHLELRPDVSWTYLR